MRKISASYIITNVGAPIKNGILILNDDNSVADLIDTNGIVKEIQDLEFYSGVLVPGFVDVFTFLSWSNLNTDQLKFTDSSKFTNQLSQLTLENADDIKSIQKGINHLEAFGTKAAADFFPSNASLRIKKNSKVSFKDIYKDNLDEMIRDSAYIFPEMTYSILGRLFDCNISKNKTYCIGTGSLSTHQKLSVFDELKYIQSLMPNLNLNFLIKLGCLNGAKALRFDNLGSFELGKNPGVNLITNVDYENFCLKAESDLKVLI